MDLDWTLETHFRGESVMPDLTIHLLVSVVYPDVCPPPDQSGRGEAPGVDTGGHQVRAELVGAQHRGHPLAVSGVDGGRVGRN